MCIYLGRIRVRWPDAAKVSVELGDESAWYKEPSAWPHWMPLLSSKAPCTLVAQTDPDQHKYAPKIEDLGSKSKFVVAFRNRRVKRFEIKVSNKQFSQTIDVLRESFVDLLVRFKGLLIVA